MSALCTRIGAIGVVIAALLSSVAAANDYPILLNYNFNGLMHAGEASNPDAPGGYRSISDRGLLVDGASGSLGTGGITGTGGIPYQIVSTAGSLDIVLLGNRNTVDSGSHVFDLTADGDNTGIQPSWLLNVDQTTAQVTSLTALNLTLDSSSQLGVLYQASNGGGNFLCTLTFTDSTSVSVQLNAPDWYQSQFPAAPGNGVSVQRQLGVYHGTDDVDNGRSPAATLNVIEAIISVSKIASDGLGSVSGKQLASISFNSRSNTHADYAVLATTVRTALGPPANDDCATASAVGEGTFSGSNARATGSDITACGANDVRDVWYSYTASVSGQAEANTCGSQLDTTVAVFDGCGGNLLGCDDNGCGLASVVQWSAQAGHNYRIRVAGVNGAEGDFTLHIINPAPMYATQAVALSYNFNALAHNGETGVPDDPNGFRAISDRALRVDGGLNSFGSGTTIGTTGIPYQVVSAAQTLDAVHLGDRNTVNGQAFVFDATPDGDNIGIQPSWLPFSDQTGPQTTDVTAQNITLHASTELGVLFQISNGGGNFDLTLAFSDSSQVTVTLNGPDWFGTQDPFPPNAGVSVQTSLGVFTGTGNVDSASADLPLNVVEAIVSVAQLINDGFGDFSGKQLTSITLGNPDNFNAGYAVYAATIREPAAAPCPGDINGDRQVNLGDLASLLAIFGDLCSGCPQDVNHDGQVNLSDLAFVLSVYGNVCP